MANPQRGPASTRNLSGVRRLRRSLSPCSPRKKKSSGFVPFIHRGRSRNMIICFSKKIVSKWSGDVILHQTWLCSFFFFFRNIKHGYLVLPPIHTIRCSSKFADMHINSNSYIHSYMNILKTPDVL